ncbi:MAG: hypothetical protein GC154_11550 [bacterium]|nr:hypothetical protein [bacterium]
MKSAAFNLAFKVHRNELSFPEALLRAVDNGAQEDFIEALNSLAGETKYSIDDLERLIEQARQKVEGAGEAANSHLQKLQEQLIKLQKSRKEHEERIATLRAQSASLKVTVAPGLNAFMIFLVAFMLTLIPFLLGFYIASLIFFSLGAVFVIVVFLQDMDKLKKEQEQISNKQNAINLEIDRYLTAIEGLKQQIEEKENLIASMPQPIDASEDPAPM